MDIIMNNVADFREIDSKETVHAVVQIQHTARC